MRTLSIYIPPLSHTRAVFWSIFVNYTHVITILCVYKCVTGNITFWLLFTTLIFIFICCRASTNRVLFWLFKLRSEFINPPPTHPPRDHSVLCLRYGRRPSQMALRSAFWVPRKTGLCTGSHENKSAHAEIRGLLKIHSNSSQAPLVADSSTSRGHGRHSYWLILSALARFKWVTKWEARHDAECTVSVLSVTVSRAFQCHEAPTAAMLRARPSNFSHTILLQYFFFCGLCWLHKQFIK